jgi:hypothetical protein
MMIDDLTPEEQAQKRLEEVRAEMMRFPHIITLPTGPTAEARLFWCMDHVGSMYTDNWTYWNEGYIGGLPENVMYMFDNPKHAILFKLRWHGAQQ